MEPSIFVAVPHYGGGIIAEAMPGLAFPSLKHRVHLRTNCVSLLAYNFNCLWCQALNERQQRGLTHFAMHHADIQAPVGWVDTLLEEMERLAADVLSVMVPMKDCRGLTSTAWFNRGSQALRRITLKEAYALPKTIGAGQAPPGYDALLVNTGLWMCRFTEDWVERAKFTIQDSIVKGRDGKFTAQVFSEDWNFSLWCAHLGLRVRATRILEVAHHGAASFSNARPWGDWYTDEQAEVKS